MENILLLAHTQSDGTLSKGALESLTAALDLSKQLGTKLSVGLIGQEVQAAANAIASSGAAKFYGISNPDLSVSRYATDAAALEALAKAVNPTLIVAPASSRFSRVLPGLAFRLKGRIDTHVTGFSVNAGTIQIQRWYYRQRMMATISRTTRPWILAIDSGIFQAWSGSSGTAAIEKISFTASDALKKTKVVGVKAPQTSAQTIRPDAKVLLVAGAGWTKKQADGQTHLKDAASLILDFLGKVQGSLGSSKSLVDQSGEGAEVLPFLSHLNQVGQTGSTPRHPKVLAT